MGISWGNPWGYHGEIMADVSPVISEDEFNSLVNDDDEYILR